MSDHIREDALAERASSGGKLRKERLVVVYEHGESYAFQFIGAKRRDRFWVIAPDGLRIETVVPGRALGVRRASVADIEALLASGELVTKFELK